MMADQSETCNKLRVLHIASGDLWAGAEVQVCTLLCQLAHTPTVDAAIVLLNDGELSARLNDAGVRVWVLDESKLNSAAIARRLLRIMRSFRPHILHTHRKKENLLGAVANLLTVRAPVVRTQHGASEHATNWRQPAKWLSNSLNRFVGRLSGTRIIAVSNHLARTLADEFPPHLIVVVRNGIDIGAVRTRQRDWPFGGTPDDHRIGFLGRLEPVKRVDIFLRAAAELRALRPDEPWRFHVFGDGTQLEMACRLAEELGIRDCVTFHGHDPNAAAYLACLDAVVLCSDHEGTPMVLLEAAAAGVPIVAHAVGGIPEIITGLPRASPVCKHTPEGYAHALHQLFSQSHTTLPSSPPSAWPYRAETNAAETLDLYREMAKWNDGHG